MSSAARARASSCDISTRLLADAPLPEYCLVFAMWPAGSCARAGKHPLVTGTYFLLNYSGDQVCANEVLGDRARQIDIRHEQYRRATV